MCFKLDKSVSLLDFKNFQNNKSRIEKKFVEKSAGFGLLLIEKIAVSMIQREKSKNFDLSLVARQEDFFQQVGSE